MRILAEASGSLVSAYLLRAIREAGHTPVASDVDPLAVGRFLADDFILMPRASDPGLWDKTAAALREHRVEVVLPSLDESLAGWAERRVGLARDAGVHVIVSDPATIAVCQDKWETYRLFLRHGIPTPATSLAQDHALVKPRRGRGSQGVCVPAGPVDMAGMISQERLTGREYTIDVFCDRDGRPVYIVPRTRLRVQEGKSVGGVVELRPAILEGVRRICAALPFRGPVNVQCFVDGNGDTRFTEINPRLAGGMALGFAATENWVRLAVDHFVHGRPVSPLPVADGLRMLRYYAEVFVPAG